jgi:hypothetical protein
MIASTIALAGEGGVIAQPHDHALFTTILQKHVVNGLVNYAAMGNDSRLEEYLAQLSRSNPRAIKDEKERLAFWVNAYNAFTIKLITDHYPVKSIREITRGNIGPWDFLWIDIAGRTYSLNQIEHEIIRKEFDEPRIHMALVCAARSCPPLRAEAYTATMLDRQLDDNAAAFLNDTTKNRYDASTGTLYLSELFKWYGADFRQRYGSAEKYVLKVLKLDNVKPSGVQYLPYDWSLNEQPSSR